MPPTRGGTRWPSIWTHHCWAPQAVHLSFIGRAALRQRHTPRPVTDGAVRLLDLAPSGVYLAATVACHAGALLPHPFTLTRRTPQKRWAGGLLSVALARRSPWVAVSNHCALWSPDFPRHGAWPAGITPAGGSTRRSHPAASTRTKS